MIGRIMFQSSHRQCKGFDDACGLTKPKHFPDPFGRLRINTVWLVLGPAPLFSQRRAGAAVMDDSWRRGATVQVQIPRSQPLNPKV